MRHTNEDNSFDNDDENLKAENAVIKLKLELEYGMKSSEFGSIDAALEHQFLSRILEFEQNYKHHQQITIHKFLGSPVFPSADNLTTEQISAELLRLTQLMEEKSVTLECIHKYGDEEIYRFITERLFFEETNDFMMSGMTWHFIYEEFLDEDENDELNR